MNKERTQIVITSFLVLILIFAWMNAAKVLNKNKPVKISSPLVEAAKQSTIDNTDSEIIFKTKPKSQDIKLQEIEWNRCPFSGAQYSSAAAVDLVISGIIWDEGNPKAIINGQILGIGDSIGDFSVEKIEKQKITLSGKDGKIELNI